MDRQVTALRELISTNASRRGSGRANRVFISEDNAWRSDNLRPNGFPGSGNSWIVFDPRARNSPAAVYVSPFLQFLPTILPFPMESLETIRTCRR